MQFSEDQEKENNEFSLEDTQDAISWDELLGESNSDLSEIIEDKAPNNKAVLSENVPDEEEPKQESFENTLENESVEYIQNEEDTTLQEEEISSDINSNQVFEEENEDYYNADKELFDQNADVPNVDDANLSGVVDDELLGLLDDKQPNAYANLEIKEPETSDKDGSLPKINTQNQTYDESQNFQNDDSYNAEVDFIPENKNKSNLSPAVMIALIFVIVLAGGYYIYTFLGNSSSTDIENLPSAEETQLQAQNEAYLAETQKQAQELQNELGVSDVKKQTQDTQNVSKKNDKNATKTSDKKVIVQVSPTGRRNPFVPSSLFNDKGYAALDITLPMPPEADAVDPQATEARKLFSIGVSGIMYDPSKPSAILRYDGKDYFVQKGDRIDNYAVYQITKDYVAIKNATNTYKAYVGEAFDLGAEIPVSNTVKVSNGTRQYVSSDSIEINRK